MFMYHRCFAISEIAISKVVENYFSNNRELRKGETGTRKCLENTGYVYIYILPLIGNCSSGGSSNHEARNAPVRDLFSLYFPPFSTISNKGAPFCRRKSTNDESWRKMKSNFNVFLFAIWLGTLEEKEKERKEGGGRSVANEIELNLKGPILRLHTRGTF